MGTRIDWNARGLKNEFSRPFVRCLRLFSVRPDLHHSTTLQPVGRASGDAIIQYGQWQAPFHDSVGPPQLYMAANPDDVNCASLLCCLETRHGGLLRLGTGRTLAHLHEESRHAVPNLRLYGKPPPPNQTRLNPGSE